MKTLFGKLLVSFISMVTLIIISVLVSFMLIYTRSYEKQIFAENDRQAQYMAQSLFAFMHDAYKLTENLSLNNDVLSMETARQTPVFIDAVKRNDYFELIYAQGMDGMQTGLSSGILGNRKERWWFIKMEQLQKPFISESYYSVGTNMPCASVFFPMQKNGEMIGIMAGDIKLSALHDYVKADADEGSWSFILDGKGVVVAHPNAVYQEELYNYVKLTRTVTLKDADGNPLQDAAGNLTEEQSFVISDAYKTAIEDMMKGNINSVKFKEDGENIFLSYRPVKLDGVSDPWYVLSVQEEDVAMRARNELIMVIFITTGFIILAALFVVFFVARSISSPITKVHLVLEKMKEGDFTNRLPVESQDEIGEMMRLLNVSQDEVGSLIKVIKEKAASLLNIGNDLATNMYGTAAAIVEITGSIQTVKGKSVNQLESVSQTKAVTDSLNINIDKLNNNIEAQTESVSQSSSAIEEMLANIQSVRQTLIHNSANVEELIKVSDNGRAGLQKVVHDIQEVAGESEGLLAINAVMENIAGQTNLLSMNAAIEAAHAGEAGKGFAVVAGEIRKLAASSTEQSKTISDVLMRIKTAIDIITVSTNMVMERFHKIEEHVRTVSEQESNIRNAMEEQGQGSKQILEAVARLSEITGMVKQGSHEMLAGSKEILDESSNLELAAGEISAGMNEMANNAEQINSAVNHVNEISDANKENIAALFDKVSKFKV